MPRSGSMQYWPRKRAKRAYARVRSWAAGKEPKLLGFAGYKAGMSHISFTDPRKSSTTKGMEITWPVTIIECPPVKV
ncbi:50S ribosomal protein L3, partial [Candidatus Woesearchaeota archaeon]|nr:50S ribosomal protein L3 [Candidatus Woesearchaeota archaeon]